jgi:hypothetical protein
MNRLAQIAARRSELIAQGPTVRKRIAGSARELGGGIATAAALFSIGKLLSKRSWWQKVALLIAGAVLRKFSSKGGSAPATKEGPT